MDLGVQNDPPGRRPDLGVYSGGIYGVCIEKCLNLDESCFIQLFFYFLFFFVSENSEILVSGKRVILGRFWGGVPGGQKGPFWGFREKGHF